MGTELLHCFPQDDAVFRAYAEAAFATAGPDDPRAIQRQLRLMYPKAVVRRQHPLAALKQEGRVWYVYRDGHYVTPAETDVVVAAVAPRDAA